MGFLWALEAAHATVRDINLIHVPADTKCWWGKCKAARWPMLPTVGLAPASQPAQTIIAQASLTANIERRKNISFFSR